MDAGSAAAKACASFCIYLHNICSGVRSRFETWSRRPESAIADGAQVALAQGLDVLDAVVRKESGEEGNASLLSRKTLAIQETASTIAKIALLRGGARHERKFSDAKSEKPKVE